MLFNSPIFLLCFLPIFFCMYFLSSGIRLRNMVITMASILFFAWGEPGFIGYVILGTGLDYLVIKYIFSDQRVDQQVKKNALIVAIILNVIALFFFKYFNFFIDQFEPLLNIANINKPSWYPIALPLGISFIAFHKISFLIDLYKQRTPPPKTFVEALVYILFFPQLISGPIVRYHEIGSQIQSRQHDIDTFLNGIFRFTFGLAKKVLIADPCGEIADSIFGLNPNSLPTSSLWIGALAYSIQIYFDFSGYSDMAIGLAKSVGFKFPENFNRPYSAISVTNFWHRWHMTLSNWMRLYLYIPLGGNRVSTWRTYLNLWIVFLISGFWHGASWTFIVWGAYHGFFLTIEKFCTNHGWELKLPKIAKQLLTMLVIMTAWVIFRADSLSYAMTFLTRMYGITGQSLPSPQPFMILFSPLQLTTLMLGILFVIIPPPQKLISYVVQKDTIAIPARYWIYVNVLFLLSLASIMAMGSSSFLYFHF